MYRMLRGMLFGIMLLLLWTGTALALDIPDAPDDLEADTYSSSRIDLTWDDSSDNETRFYIYRKTGSSGSYSQIDYVGSNTEEYSDTNLDEGTKYYYKICAYNSYGYSNYSNEDYATTEEEDSSDDLEAPDNLDAEAYSSSRIDLTWDDNSSSETKFYIYRKTGSSGTYDRIAIVDEDEEEYRDTDLDEGTKYYYKVRAYDGDDYSDYSDETYATTEDEDDDSTGDLDAPDNLEAESYSSSRIDLTWDDNSSGETRFYIYRKTGSSGSYTEIASVSSNTKEYRDTNVEEDTKYYYKIRAYDGDEYSDYSDEDYATAGDSSSSGDIDAPDNLEADARSNSRIDLTWDDNSSDATRFYIYRKTGSSGSYSQIASVRSNIEEYSDTGLKSGTKYYYKIRAYDGDDYSDYCDEEYATTTGNNPDELEAPGYLTATDSGGLIKLTWIDNTSNEAAFVIERKVASGNYAELTWLGPNITNYSDTTVTSAGTSYTYRVRAYNSIGYSEYSNTASAQPSSVKNELRFTPGKKTYSYKNQQFNMDAAPINLNDRVMIPIRYVTDQLGANVTWDSSTKKVTITYKTKTIELWAGKRTARVNSVNKYIDDSNSKVLPVIIPPGRIMLPIRFVSENLGCQVSWDAATKTAIITLP